MTGRALARRAPFLPAYAALATVDVALASQGRRRARWLTKPMLMPLLAAHVAQARPHDARGDRAVLAGLGLSAVGDVALLGEGEVAFGVGLASFLAAHCCYLRAFLARRGGGVRRSPAIAGLYALVGLVLSAVLFPRTGRLRAPVLAYGAALVGMATAALETGDPAVTAGGAAFLVSDSILALGAFDVASVPGGEALVMLSYTAAQALIALGTVGGAA